MNITVSEAVASGQLRTLGDAFRHAAQTYPDHLTESAYGFAGKRVHLRVIGRDLARHIGLPFSHLRADGPCTTVPRLNIDLWDERLTGICRRHGSSSADSGWRQVTGLSADGRFVLQELPNTLVGYDRTSARIVGSIAWGDGLFVYERAKPLARLLLQWHNDQSIQVIHAGLVSRAGEGVLFAGKSGSGKTTAALACLCGGFDFLSEDYVGLERLEGGQLAGHSMYCSAFVERSHLALFPDLLPHVVEDSAGRDLKAAVMLSQAFPVRMARSATIRALVTVSVTDVSQSRYRTTSKGQALLGLGPSSLIQIPSQGVRGFEALWQLVERVPSYALALGTDLASIPRCVDEILTEASA